MQYFSVKPQRLEVASYTSKVCLRRLQLMQPAAAGLASLAAVLTATNLDYSPTAETLMAETPQKTDCFLGKSPDWLHGIPFRDFPKSS